MKDKTFRMLYEVEKTHWWHRARREILKKVVHYYCRTSLNTPSLGSTEVSTRSATGMRGRVFHHVFFGGQKRRVLDIGCGTGANLQFLNQFGNVTGLETSQEAIEICRERGFKDVLRGDITQCPAFLKQNAYDIVTLFDVLEHIKNESDVLVCLAKLIRQEGYLFITVPAFSFLWSSFDEFSHHYRRYTVKILKKKLEYHGFTIKNISYFNMFLFPLIFMVRKVESLFHICSSENDLRPPPRLLNSLFFFIFQSEKYFFPKFRFPFGVSILCVAQRK